MQVREGAGKKAARNLRKQGFVPCVVYKGGKDAIPLKLPKEDVMAALHTKAGENVLIGLKISQDSKPLIEKTVIIKEVQHHPLRDDILHIDFNEISLTETIKVNVPIVSKGEPVGVKQDEGILEHIMWELHVECLPQDIPEKIEYEVSELKIGDSVLVRDLPVPSGVKVLNDPELITMVVKPPHVEKPKEEMVEEVAEPELIRKEKKEEEEVEEEPAKESSKEEKKEGKSGQSR